ncbi:hypothetical protein AKJ53_01270 [candidate division MSBL1 archaeon SCGC-AAA382F02]|uniref:DUF7210 domain-containing protein n=1 Tax=candidate division MSBL1 archaeon SCGC-AAA382F02 TaxID=1698282 RepID=A0A133VI28_9EURY|nr:hypothetical protein AKJ53_01270 [candidate division MSBL1 archaeon SCGC-AAA382F02]
MKIKVTENFSYDGEKYEEGDTVDLPEPVADSVIEKGFGEKVKEETPVPEIKGEEKKRGPRWKKKVWVSEDRNFGITVWPPGGKFDSPSVTLEENQRDDSGNWETNRTYLPTGSNLLALSEHLKSAWEEIQKVKSEEKE